MLIISVRPVRSSRVYRDCAECCRLIPRGSAVVTLYGMAEPGQKPSALHFHPECCAGDDERIYEARRGLGVPDDAPARESICHLLY